MNEHGFVKAVHRALPLTVYKWKIADRYTNGVPDSWYSGPSGDLWAEYKFLSRVPRKSFTVPLTELQRIWLTARHTEGRRTAVIVGSPKGAVILTSPSEWNSKVSVDCKWIQIKEVAAWITTQLS